MYILSQKKKKIIADIVMLNPTLSLGKKSSDFLFEKKIRLTLNETYFLY